MNLGLAAGVIVGSTAFMVVAMLLLRRRAPAGGFFSDSDRASGVFGFLGAGFVILLGFVIFLSFESYSNAKAKAEDEATAVVDQFAAAGLFPATTRAQAQAELVCYGRSVVGYEWPAMKSGNASPVTEGWIEALDRTLPATTVVTLGQDAAVKDWFDAADARELGRRARLLESRNVIPGLLWVMIIIGAVLVVAYVLLYADSGERVVAQVLMMGGVTALVVSSLLAVVLLASPFQNESGSLKPASMRYTLHLIGQELAKDGRQLPSLCDASGKPG